MITTRKPRHPGALIKRQYLEPLGMTITELASVLDVSRKTISEIVNEQAGVSPLMAIRLAKAFQTSPELWLNLQQKHDLWNAVQESESLNEIFPVNLQPC